MGQLMVCTPSVPQSVHAWILWEDGVEELVQAHAVAWTKWAVLVRFEHHLTSMRSGCGQGLLRGLECDNWGHGETRMSA